VSVLHVSVRRGDAWQGFEVPRRESQTVLDVVTYIQRHLDPTLAYRYACRVGMCGSCAMTVNGAPRWTCRTHVDSVAKKGRLEVAPLRNLPVIRDLVTDMREFFDKWARAQGQFQGARKRSEDFARVAPQSAQRKLADAGIECIGCAVCYSACDVVAWNPDYLGPAALNRAWTLANDERDTAQAGRLRAVAGDAGCHACHTHLSCTERCPKALSPTAGIAGLKRATAKAEPLWVAQRASAAVLALCVLVHLATIVYAVRGGLTGAEILARTQGNPAWLAFYALFVLAVTVHAPIGLRAVLGEWLGWRGRSRDLALCAFAVLLAGLGLRAVLGVFA
jgi:fumarate reductase iron-sulfur subunit